MATSADTMLRVPEHPGTDAPLVPAPTIDLMSAEDQSVQPGTRNYLGTGVGAKLHSISPAAPTASTAQLRGPAEDMNELIRGLRLSGGAYPLQVVTVCDGATLGGWHYRRARFLQSSSPNPLTARGINVSANPLEQVISVEWDGPELLFSGPDQSRPVAVLTNHGLHYEAPLGTIDGSNALFTLTPPTDDPTSVVVTLDGVVLEVDVDYTVSEDGSTVTFVVAPACDTEVLVYWQDANAQAMGLEVIKAQMCDSISAGSCSGRVSDGCQVLYVLFAKPGATGNVCAGSADKTAVLARYIVDRQGGATLDGIQEFGSVINPVDMLCGQVIVIAAQTGIFLSCGALELSGGVCNCTCGAGGVLGTATISANLGSGIKRLAWSDRGRGRYFALYGDSGVLVSDNARVWSIGLLDGSLTTQPQNDIKAAGDLVVTVGDANTVQRSSARGRAGSWGSCRGGATISYDLEAVGLDITMPSENGAALYIYANNGDESRVYASGDFGNTWEERLVSSAPEYSVQLHAVVDGCWIYLADGAELHRNLSKGQDCDWQEISSPEITWPVPGVAICPVDPAKTFEVSPEFVFVDHFSGVNGQDITDHTPFFSVLAAAWASVGASEPTLLNGYLANTAGAGVVLVDTGLTDALVQAIVQVPAAGTAGVVLRYLNANNLLIVQLSEAGNTMTITETVGGVPTVQATVAVTIDAGKDYALRVVAYGPVIQATLNNATTIVWGEAPVANTKWGLSGVLNAQFDDFSIV